MGGNWGAVINVMLPYIMTMVLMVVLFCVLLIIAIKLMSRGKILAILHEDRRIYSRLLKEDVTAQCLWLGPENSENREKYNVDEDLMFWMDWPAGLPAIFQTQVRAHEYVRRTPDPHDPYKQKRLRSAVSERIQTDEMVLKAQWRDTRESLGMVKSKATNLYVLMGVALMLILQLYGLYVSAQGQASINAVKKLLGG